MQDAVVAFKKIEQRIHEIVEVVLKKRREMFDEDGWTIGGIALHRDVVAVKLQADWSDRPVTTLYGDPEDDDYAVESYDRFTKIVRFPISYLSDPDWETREEAALAQARRYRAAWELESARDRLVEYQGKVESVKSLITNLEKQLESDP